MVYGSATIGSTTSRKANRWKSVLRGQLVGLPARVIRSSRFRCRASPDGSIEGRRSTHRFIPVMFVAFPTAVGLLVSVAVFCGGLGAASAGASLRLARRSRDSEPGPSPRVTLSWEVGSCVRELSVSLSWHCRS